MSLLDLMPQVRAARLATGVLGPLAGILVVGAVLAWAWHATERAKVAVAQAESRALAAEKASSDLRARNAELVVAAERIRGSATDLITHRNEEIDHAKEQERAAQAAVVAGLRASLGSVSGQLARINAATAVPGGGADQAARIASDGETIRTLDGLFGRCSVRYVAMAERAGKAGAAGAECEQRYDSAKAVIDAAADAAERAASAPAN